MTLTNKTKELMLIVIDNNMALVPIMHQLSHYRDVNKFLKWLIMNRIIGFNLLDWLKINHNNSVMGMVKFITRYHNKELEDRAIILGKDWIK